jgi:hypothetical protein
MESSQRFGFPSQSTQRCDVGLACHASEVPETAIERARSCSAQFYLWRSIHLRLRDDASARDLWVEIEGLLLQCWCSSLQTKNFAGFLQIIATCRIEGFFGTSGSSAP